MLAEIPRSPGYLLLCKYPTPTPIFYHPYPPTRKNNKNQPDTNTYNIIHNLYNHNIHIPYSISITYSSYPLSLYLNPKIATHTKNQNLSSYYFIYTHLQTRKSDHKKFPGKGFKEVTISPQGPKTYTIRQSQSLKSSTQ